MTTSIHLCGNITREPDLRVLPNGSSNVRMGVAVNRRWQDKGSGDWKEETSYFDVVAWRDLADNVAESLHKGDRVIITGRLEQRQYEAKDGSNRNVVEVIADEIGPSLRWAQCRVERTERSSNGAQQSMSL